MTVLPYQAVKRRCQTGMIAPWYERGTAHGVSYGLSCAGYDVRIDQNVTLWPKGTALASTIEYFEIPDDLIGFVMPKSTHARMFYSPMVTVVEAGWSGFLTLELVNHSWRIIRLRRGTAIGQLVFWQLTAPSTQPYSGKYQNQPRGPQPAIFVKDGSL